MFASDHFCSVLTLPSVTEHAGGTGREQGNHPEVGQWTTSRVYLTTWFYLTVVRKGETEAELGGNTVPRTETTRTQGGGGGAGRERPPAAA